MTEPGSPAWVNEMADVMAEKEATLNANLRRMTGGLADAENKQEDTMTEYTPTTDQVRAEYVTNRGMRVPTTYPVAEEFNQWLAAHDAEVHKPLADLAFEGALLIEWVRQVIGSHTPPSAADLNDLFDQCSDYSDKWNSGSTTPLPDPRLPSFDSIREALNTAGAFCGTCGREPGDEISTCRDCVEVLTRYTEAVLAIMPKPTDTEETNR